MVTGGYSLSSRRTKNSKLKRQKSVEIHLSLTLMRVKLVKNSFHVIATDDVETRTGSSNVEKRSIPYPKHVFCIVSMEACERFSFYGMNSKSVYKHFYTSLPF